MNTNLSSRSSLKLTVLALLWPLALSSVRALEWHVATSQDLQNALTEAAGNGADNNIYLTNGYYIGNFNFNSSGGHNLTIQAESGLTNTAAALDGGGIGRNINLVNTGNGNFTIRNLTFLRNCGNSGFAAVRIAGGSGCTILLDNCQFLEPSLEQGMGVEIASGANLTLSNCVFRGTTPSGTLGASVGSVSPIPGVVQVQACTFVTNSGSALYLNAAGSLVVSNSIFTGNNVSLNANASSVSVTANSFIGNRGLCNVSSSGSLVLLGNTFIGNNTGAQAGGAICSASTGLTVSQNVFVNNVGASAGGLFCGNGASVVVSGNIFSGNSGGGAGGAVVSGQTGIVSRNSFTGNSGGIGGANFVCSTNLISNNTFSANQANNGGGANCGGNSSTLTGNTFTGNSAFGIGGGIILAPSYAAIVSGNTFKQNTAVQQGGAIYATGPTLTINDNLVANNTQTGSSFQGGGIWVNASSTLFLINNTIFGNSAGGSGGGVAFQVNGTVELLNVYNNIIWGNSATNSGGDIWLAGVGQKKTLLYNDVNDMYGVWDIAQNLINVSPNFFDPVNGDYHLRTNSSCANAGTNGAPALPAMDLDGSSRTNALGQVDLGCYEFNTMATHPADTNANFVITAAEFNGYATAWKNGLTWSSQPTVIPADYVTRAGYLMTNGGTYHNDGSARPVNWKLGP